MAPAAITTSSASPTRIFASAFALTTTFTAPKQCAQSIGGLTMLQLDEFKIWLNAPLPVPGVTITSCYPSQFASSFLLQTGGVSQAAFSPLVCPQGYTTQEPFTSHYVACCPSGWDGFAPAASAPSDRPAFGGTCFTNIFNKPIQITSYDASAIKASSIFTATGTKDQAFAYPYEGFALGVAVQASTVPTIAASTTSSPSAPNNPSSVSASPTSSVTAASVSSTSGLSNTGTLVGLIVGCIIAALLLAALAMFALKYRKKRMLPSSARAGRKGDFPDYAAHIRLDNDSPTPMVYLGQPPEVVTDWTKTQRRDCGLTTPDIKAYEAGELEGHKVEKTVRFEVDGKVISRQVDAVAKDTGDVKVDAKVYELPLSQDTSGIGVVKAAAQAKEVEGLGNVNEDMENFQNVPQRQTIYELDAAVDAMMGEMVDMMKSKKLPPLPVPQSPT